jgi:sugar lactone lactonase YvrE
MRRAHLVVCALAFAVAVPRSAHAWDRGHVSTFAVLPAGSGGPEGLEVDAHGNVYVGSFGFTATGPVAPTQGQIPHGQIFVFDAKGRFVRQLSVQGSSPNLLGLHWQVSSGKLLVADFTAGQVLSVDPVTGTSTVFMPPPATPGTTSLNDITEDGAGNVYVSDSFQGTIWKTPPTGGTATAFVSSPLLTTTGVPPFGANGLRFNAAQDALFVANTGNDTIVRIPVTAGAAGTPAVFVNSVNGADGLEIDAAGNLWIAANQADEIVVIDPTGKVIAKLGDFGGAIDKDGAPVGLLFPASLRLVRGAVLVTNLALDLRLVNPTFVSVDSPWAAQVRRYTVSRLDAKLK